MVISTRQRSPLGAPYRTALGALGVGAPEPVTAIWICSVIFAAPGFGPVPDPPVNCVEQIDANANYDYLRIDWVDISTQDVPNQQKWIDQVAGTYWQGNTSGNIHRAGAPSSAMFCTNALQARDIWNGGYDPGVGWLYVSNVPATPRYLAESICYNVGNILPGWVDGESLTQIPAP